MIMKKTILSLLAAMSLLCTGCFSTGLGTTTAANSGTNVLGSVLGSVLGNVLFGGGMMLDQSSLVGNWNYSAPKAAFTTQQAFASAGGDAATSQLASALASNFNTMGITRQNTSFSFLQGNQFKAQVHGIPFNGTYAYNQENGEITLKSGTQAIKGNVTKTANGIGLMFDATQMTNMLQKVGKVSNAQAVKAVSQLAKSSNGARVGFELTK